LFAVVSPLVGWGIDRLGLSVKRDGCRTTAAARLVPIAPFCAFTIDPRAIAAIDDLIGQTLTRLEQNQRGANSTVADDPTPKKARAGRQAPPEGAAPIADNGRLVQDRDVALLDIAGRVTRTSIGPANPEAPRAR
jgi:hypothetical protein